MNRPRVRALHEVDAHVITSEGGWRHVTPSVELGVGFRPPRPRGQAALRLLDDAVAKVKAQIEETR